MNDEVIRVFVPGSAEFSALQSFADRLNAHGGTIRYTVETTYFDHGQDWKWTTLIAHRTDAGGVLSSWQAIWPPEQWSVIHGSEQEKAAIEERLLARK